MAIKFSVHSLIKKCLILFSILLLNSVRADNNIDYINSLNDEAEITEMKNVVPSNSETIPEPAVTPDKSTDIKNLTYQVIVKLQQTLGIKNRTANINTEDDLKDIFSSALAQGNTEKEIRDIVNLAMTGLNTHTPSSIKTEIHGLVSKALSQVTDKNKRVSNAKNDYIQSLDKELKSHSTQKIQSIESFVTLKTNRNNKGHLKQNLLNSGETTTVLKGDNLSKISQRVYGSSNHYMILYKANKDIIVDPNVIEIGQILQVPLIP